MTQETERLEPFEAPADDDGPRPREPETHARQHHHTHGRRSLMVPLLLIAVGAVVLLQQLGLLGALNWWTLLQFWPVLLILVGVDLLFSRVLPLLATLFEIAAVVALVGVLVSGAAIGGMERADDYMPWLGIETGDVSIRSERFADEMQNADSARVRLDLGRYDTTVGPVGDESLLFEADVSAFEPFVYTASGSANREIALGLDRRLPILGLVPDVDDHAWVVGLSDRVPLSLDIDASSGYCVLDLEDLRVDDLVVDVGSGGLRASLPARELRLAFEGGSGATSFAVADEADVTMDIEMRSGSLLVDVGDDAALDLRVVDGGSGSLTVQVPDDMPVRVEVNDSGSGSVVLPSELRQTQRGEDDEGTWETGGLDDGDRAVEITIDSMSSGQVIVKYR